MSKFHLKPETFSIDQARNNAGMRTLLCVKLRKIDDQDLSQCSMENNLDTNSFRQRSATETCSSDRIGCDGRRELPSLNSNSDSKDSLIVNLNSESLRQRTESIDSNNSERSDAFLNDRRIADNGITKEFVGLKPIKTDSEDSMDVSRISVLNSESLQQRTDESEAFSNSQQFVRYTASLLNLDTDSFRERSAMDLEREIGLSETCSSGRIGCDGRRKSPSLNSNSDSKDSLMVNLNSESLRRRTESIDSNRSERSDASLNDRRIADNGIMREFVSLKPIKTENEDSMDVNLNSESLRQRTDEFEAFSNSQQSALENFNEPKTESDEERQAQQLNVRTEPSFTNEDNMEIIRITNVNSRFSETEDPPQSHEPYTMSTTLDREVREDGEENDSNDREGKIQKCWHCPDFEGTERELGWHLSRAFPQHEFLCLYCNEERSFKNYQSYKNHTLGHFQKNGNEDRSIMSYPQCQDACDTQEALNTFDNSVDATRDESEGSETSASGNILVQESHVNVTVTTINDRAGSPEFNGFETSTSNELNKTMDSTNGDSEETTGPKHVTRARKRALQKQNDSVDMNKSGASMNLHHEIQNGSFVVSNQDSTSHSVSQKKNSAETISASVPQPGEERDREALHGSENVMREEQEVCVILSRAGGISNHMTAVPIEKPKSMHIFCCDTCQKEFKWKKGSSSHLIIHKTNQTNPQLEKTFSCEECKNQFSQKSGLKRHILSVHQNQKPHACNHCKKAFRDKAGLKKHMGVVHLKDPKFTKRFGCESCGRAFSQRNNLILHLQSHETQVWLRKPFGCQECGKWFSRKIVLKQHILVSHLNQSQYICDYCQKTFGYKTNLTKHMKSFHLNDPNYMKRFVCLNCEKGFGSQYHLTRHLQAHQKGLLEQKRFSCG